MLALDWHEILVHDLAARVRRQTEGRERFQRLIPDKRSILLLGELRRTFEIVRTVLLSSPLLLVFLPISHNTIDILLIALILHCKKGSVISEVRTS